MPLDATQIIPGLYQGSAPPPGRTLAQAGFKKLILCAMEFQPPHLVPAYANNIIGLEAPDPFPGVEVFYAPNDDNPLEPATREQLLIAIGAARSTAMTLQHGGKVLVTCWMGLNRSGLVSALTLHILLGCSGRKAVQMVQQKRPNALKNPQFVSHLNRIRPTR